MSALRIGLLRHPLLAAWLVLLALTMRLLVPPGYMVGNSAAGSIRIEPCSGVSMPAMAMTGPMAAHHGHHQDRTGHEQPCAFAGLAVALDEPPPLTLDLPRLIVETWATTTGTAVAIGRGLAAPPPPSTGPPLV